jgi:hypothetical protein
MSERHKYDKWDDSLSNAFGLIMGVLGGATLIGTLVTLMLYPKYYM